MAIIGSTDRGRGRYELTLTHDPDSVATVGLTGSTAHNVDNDTLWLKLDDGETTNWINLGSSANISTTGFTGNLNGITDAQSALDFLDTLTWDGLPGAKTYFTVGFQDSEKPYVTFNSTSWTGFSNIIFPGTSTYSVGAFKVIASRTGTNGSCDIRLYDLTNLNAIGTVNFSSDVVQIITQSTLTNLPVGEAIFEVQARKSAGSASSGRLHSIAIA